MTAYTPALDREAARLAAEFAEITTTVAAALADAAEASHHSARHPQRRARRRPAHGPRPGLTGFGHPRERRHEAPGEPLSGGFLVPRAVSPPKSCSKRKQFYCESKVPDPETGRIIITLTER